MKMRSIQAQIRFILTRSRPLFKANSEENDHEDEKHPGADSVYLDEKSATIQSKFTSRFYCIAYLLTDGTGIISCEKLIKEKVRQGGVVGK